MADDAILRHALKLGVWFLRRRQNRNGVWKGFRLPPGPATSWLTAHVAWVCEDVPELHGACRRAALHLERVGPDDGSGATTGKGRRSTATAPRRHCSSWTASRRPVPDFLLEALMRAQLPGGGVATYAPAPARPGGWHTAHPDVTVVAVEALRRYGFAQAAERALDWVEAETLRSGSRLLVARSRIPACGSGRRRASCTTPRTAGAVTAALADTRPAPRRATARRRSRPRPRGGAGAARGDSSRRAAPADATGRWVLAVLAVPTGDRSARD